MKPDQRRPIRVFAHLAHDKDVRQWRAARASGALVGHNDDTPYGYGRASHMGCDVTFPSPSARGHLGQLCRLGLRLGLGFDLAHAWRQRDALMASDVVWTHTESQFLAAAVVLGARPHGPKLIGQAVWLYDRWPRIPAPQRALYRRLVERVDVLTTLSPLNAAAARALFPGKRVEVVPFGIPSEGARAPRTRRTGPCRVLALGNDRHRDWATLVTALRDVPEVELEILSQTAPARLAGGAGNVRIRPARTNAELRAAFDRATMVAVPLFPNLHASGITVIQEAVLSGLPVVATDTGGLRFYFGADAVTYVPPQDPAALRRAIGDVREGHARAEAMARRAQARMVEGGLDAEGYVRRHVELSEDILP